MSHFAVLVIGENIEEQLEPFWELDLNREDEKNDKRSIFLLKIEEDYLEEEFQKFKIDHVKYLQERKEEYKNKIKDHEPEKDLNIEQLGNKIEEIDNQINNINFNYPDAKSWVDSYGYVYSTNEDGISGYGYYYNPNAKWDSYLIGGRWTGFFKLKSGSKGKLGKPGVFGNKPKVDYADSVLKKDIDWEGMKVDLQKEALKIWNEAEEDQNKKDEYRRWSYGIRENERLEDFIKRYSCIQTFAVLYNGNWYERGSMGWWAIVSNEKDLYEWQREFDKLIESLPEDSLLTIVDCHI